MTLAKHSFLIPMYFFLSNLSFLHLLLTLARVFQMLSHIWGPEKSIIYTGVSPSYVCSSGSHAAGGDGICYFATCQLCILMLSPLYWKLVFLTWLSGLIVSLVQYSTSFQLLFSSHHFFESVLQELPVNNLYCCIIYIFSKILFLDLFLFILSESTPSG